MPSERKSPTRKLIMTRRTEILEPLKKLDDLKQIQLSIIRQRLAASNTSSSVPSSKKSTSSSPANTNNSSSYRPTQTPTNVGMYNTNPNSSPLTTTHSSHQYPLLFAASHVPIQMVPPPTQVHTTHQQYTTVPYSQPMNEQATTTPNVSIMQNHQHQHGMQSSHMHQHSTTNNHFSVNHHQQSPPTCCTTAHFEGKSGIIHALPTFNNEHHCPTDRSPITVRKCGLHTPSSPHHKREYHSANIFPQYTKQAITKPSKNLEHLPRRIKRSSISFNELLNEDHVYRSKQ